MKIREEQKALAAEREELEALLKSKAKLKKLIASEISADAERERAKIVDYARSWEAVSAWSEETVLWERLAELITGADDGLLARIQWAWPDPVPFRLGRETPRAAWAIEALDRLRELDLKPGDPPSPIEL